MTRPQHFKAPEIGIGISPRTYHALNDVCQSAAPNAIRHNLRSRFRMESGCRSAIHAGRLELLISRELGSRSSARLEATVNGMGGLERSVTVEIFSTRTKSDTMPAGSAESPPATGNHRPKSCARPSSALKCMEHRGGVCGEAGDGAGITTTIPQAFLKEEAKRLQLDGARHLKPEDALAVGRRLPPRHGREQGR